MRKPAALLSTALVLAGCASQPGYRAPAVDVPPEFRELSRDTLRDSVIPPAAPAPAAPTGEAASLDPRFWRALGDSTLDRLVGEVLRANLDVRAAAAPLGWMRRSTSRLPSLSAARIPGSASPALPSRSAREAFPIRTSGTPASTRRGSSTCSAGSGEGSRPRGRWSAQPGRTCGTRRWR
jgi:outer membrane protein TolC